MEIRLIKETLDAEKYLCTCSNWLKESAQSASFTLKSAKLFQQIEYTVVYSIFDNKKDQRNRTTIIKYPV